MTPSPCPVGLWSFIEFIYANTAQPENDSVILIRRLNKKLLLNPELGILDGHRIESAEKRNQLFCKG